VSAITDALEGEIARNVRPLCKFARVLDELPPEDAEAIERAHLSAPAVSRVLSAAGISVSSSSVRYHRAGTCACPREARS
jgi:hypothetical protein